MSDENRKTYFHVSEEDVHLLFRSLDATQNKLEEHSDALTEILVAIARLESRQVCSDPFACSRLQLVVETQAKKISRLEHAWAILLGGWGVACIGGWLAWEWVKTFVATKPHP